MQRFRRLRVSVILVSLAACSQDDGGGSPTGPADSADAHDSAADAQDSADTAPDAAPEGCSAARACGEGAQCHAPGEVICGGACRAPPATCDSDAACQATDPESICVPLPCACGGETECVTGCRGDEGNCAPWEFCAPTGYCVADVCLRDADCPADFACTPPDNPHCARKSCSSDDQCVGYCVNGACYDALGTCSLPVP